MRFPLFRTSSAVAGALSSLLLALASPAKAAVITVTDTGDLVLNDGLCTLREAIVSANFDSSLFGCTEGSGADEIVLPPGLYLPSRSGTLEDVGWQGDLDITDSVTLSGAGVGQSIIDGTYLMDRLFQIHGGSVTVQNLTIRNGGTDGPTTAGGCFWVNSQFALLNSEVIGCKGTFGGALLLGDASVVIVRGSLLAGNQATFDGGAIFTNSRAASLENTTISGNSAADSGAIYASFSEIEISSCTVTANSTTAAGTFAQPRTGGIFIRGPYPPVIRSSIIAGNTSFGTVDDGHDLLCETDNSGLTSLGNNVFQHDNPSHPCSPYFGESDLVGVSAELGPLADNGGPTRTHQPEAGSPVIGAGVCVNTDGVTLAVDQRGEPRPRPEATGCDIGAYERGACGDGVVDLAEDECDDGEGNSDTEPDACRLDCTPASCGDGVTDTGEECDDGAENGDFPDACRAGCIAPSCGDSVIDSDEECDNGGANSDEAPDACRENCEAAGCGDGVVDSDEECDEGGANSQAPDAACRTTCKVGGCGDGVIDSDEECDDGDANAEAADACRTDRTLPDCGDGVTDTGEECDDGEANSDTEPSACRTTCIAHACGDGITDADEECDDAGANSDTEVDACRENCKAAHCGDEVIDTGEFCDDGVSKNANSRPGACRRDCQSRNPLEEEPAGEGGSGGEAEPSGEGGTVSGEGGAESGEAGAPAAGGRGGGSGAAGGSAGSGGAGGSVSKAENESSGGCGCSIPGHERGSSRLLALLAAAAVLMRRRSGPRSLALLE